MEDEETGMEIVAGSANDPDAVGEIGKPSPFALRVLENALLNPNKATSAFVTGGKSITLSLDQEVRASKLPREEKRLFLYAYATSGTLAGAEAMMVHDGQSIVNTNMHYSWLRTDPNYKELFEEIDQSISDAWDALYQEKAVAGVVEEYYDANGNVTRSKRRQDPTMLQSVVATKTGKYRQDRGDGGTIVQIVIERTAE